MFVMGKLVSRPVPPGRCRSSRRYFSLRSKETTCIKPKTIITCSLEWDNINFHTLSIRFKKRDGGRWWRTPISLSLRPPAVRHAPSTKGGAPSPGTE